MASWKNKNSWERPINGTNRMNGRKQVGSQGNRVQPTYYEATFGSGFPRSNPTLPNGAFGPRFDLPNSLVYNRLFAVSVPFPAARNKAWENLVDAVHKGSASLGVSIAEMGESLGMIEKRCTQMYRGYRALRRGQFRKFLSVFGIGAKRKHRNLVRNSVNQASGLWLEYSFGWKPCVQDVYAGIHALGQPVPGGTCFGKGREDINIFTRPHNGQGEKYIEPGRCRMRADVYITNPNLYLLQQLGLANPASVAWEIVPFSFVVDWVFDVGTFLNAFSDFLGCTVLNACTTYSTKGTVTSTYYWDYPPSTTRVVSGKIALVKRKVGLDFPFPNFQFHANLGTSLTRAANAASLLGQILSK